MRDNGSATDEPPLVSNRVMDIVVALLFLAVSGVFLFDSARIGFGWLEGQGPAPGSFPFYIALIMAVASLINLVRAVRDVRGRTASFVSRRAFGRVIAVLLPAFGYVALIGYAGIYVSSALFITAFMLVLGRESPFRAIAVGLAVPLALFLMFEKWFLVPLPKGPIEAMLGY